MYTHIPRGLLTSIRNERGSNWGLKGIGSTAKKYVLKRHEADNTDAINRFRDSKEIEPEVCKSFGCGKILSLEESRCGGRCRKHSIVEKMDIVNVIKFR